MSRLNNQKKSNIRMLAKLKFPGVAVALKNIALDKKECSSIRKEAVVALGSFGGASVEPLTDIMIQVKDPKTKKAAMAILHAFGKLDQKQDWSREMRDELAGSILLASVLIETIM
jgi:hypothetical protein